MILTVEAKYVASKNTITRQLASDQARIAEIMETVQAEVDRHDQMILQLEKQLHDAHHTLVREIVVSSALRNFNACS